MNLRRALRICLPAIALMMSVALSASADVTRIDIKTRTDVLNGKSWGSVGPYERITGTVHFTVDPKNPHNKNIVNLDKAPRNAQGLVEYSADIYIVAPKDQSKGNGVAFFEVPNRGNRSLPGRFALAPRGGPGGGPNPETEFGDGSLLTQGYTLVWLGWQFSLARNGNLIGIDLPIATENGQPITGRVTAPFTVNMPGPTLNLDADTAHYTPVDLNSPDATLTVVQNVYDTPRTIQRDQWQFAKVVNGQVVPDATSLYMKDGFQAGQTYQLSYMAKNTPVGALGYSTLRDVASTFKKGGSLVTVKYAYVFGASQTGRFLREFLYEGFNTDEQGHKALDLVWAHIGGNARGDFTQPFSLPNGLGVFTGSMFPFSATPEHDLITGKTDGLLMHMSKDTVPKVILTNGDCEYWGGGRSASLIYMSLDGKKELKQPDNVRIYMLAGTQHEFAAFPPNAGQAQQRANPNDYNWALRAILAGADSWVRNGTEPPPSRYPELSDGTLVAQKDVNFPALPGVQSPSIIPGGYRADLGGPTSAKLPFLVPKVDADGNDMGGIRLPDIAVPLATYTGWNFRKPENGAPTEIVPLTGSFFPFPVTHAEAEQNHDPRKSIQERYASREAYLAQVKGAADKLVQERYVLSQDVDLIVKHAGVVYDTLTGGATKKSE